MGILKGLSSSIIIILITALAGRAEFQVNTYTTDDQQYPAIATDAQNNFVVVWRSKHTGSRGTYGQRFSADGTPIGDEFQINANSVAGCTYCGPSVAMDSSGNFVVTWTGSGDGSLEGIYARRYDANGQPLTGEFLVNSYTNSRQIYPSTAMSSDGKFVIVWSSYYHSTLDWYTRGQLYNSSGAPVGGEFIVSQESHSFQPDVAMDDSGDFVVIFERRPGYYVYMRRYNADGTAKGSAADVSGNLGARSHPSIGMAGGGNYVVAWHCDPESGFSNPDVYAKRYDSSGSAIGSTFVVNTYTDGGQWHSSVATNDSNEFTVVWNMGDIYGQRYKSDGTPVGDEFQINTYIVSDQKHADIVMNDSGEFVTVWQSEGQDGDDYGIFGEFGPKICCADFDGDLYVNFRDFAFLAEEWLQEGDLLQTDLVDDNKINELDLGALSEQWLAPCYECSQVDIYSDGKIDFKDYTLLIGDWQKQGPLDGDITGNGTVDMADFKALLLHWVKDCE